jgi:hypothetical protein
MPSSASFKSFANSPRGQGCPCSFLNQPCTRPGGTKSVLDHEAMLIQ